jgi:hypothetical protein
MTNESKHKLLTAVFLSALLICSVYAVLIPNVQASEMTIEQKGLAVLSNVVGLDTAKYVVNAKEYPPDSYLGVLPQENIRYKLEADGSTVDVLYTFANGNLRLIHVLETEGSPRMSKSSATAVEMAKDFLSNYQSYSKDSLYGELGSMLTDLEPNKDLAVTSGYVKLEATTSGDSATFRWTYQHNGIEAPDKCVVLGYKNGFLEYFIDNWNLYQIGSTSVNVSENEAKAIGMDHARTFSWKGGSGDNAFEVKNFNVTQAMVWQTVFWSSVCADTPRNKDLLMLYPVRHVWVSLDKFYPGNVYGIEVYVWADTGEICHIQERFSTLDPPTGQLATIDDIVDKPSVDSASVAKAESNSSITWIALPALVAVVLGTAPFWLGRKKRLSLKIGGILLCLLISSSTLLVPISTVNATSYYGRATIWGSESTGADDRDPPDSSSWRKTGPEIEQQRATAQNITSSFSSNGYYASNYQGSGSIKAQILSNISYNEANYAHVAVVDFDHGVGGWNMSDIPANEFHYMFEDNVGTYHNGQWHVNDGVYDYQIYQETSNNTFFVLINTCLSARINETIYNPETKQYDINSSQGLIDGERARGMPYAWTHRIVNWKGFENFSSTNHISMFGYSDPDNSPFCYIGFPYGSAALNQTVQDGSPVGYHTWVEKFFAYALQYDMTVNQALDHASCLVFSRYFYDTSLYTGFPAVWPTWFEGHWNATPFNESTLAVYGNGNIKLYQPSISLSARDNNNNPLSTTFTIDGQQGYSGSYRLTPTVHSISVPDKENYAFSHFNYNGANYYNRPANILLDTDGTLTAYYTWNPTYYWLSVLSSSGGSVSPGSQQYQSGEAAYQEAVPDNSSWVLDQWILDGNNVGMNPEIYVGMNWHHTLYANFTAAPSYNFAASILDHSHEYFPLTLDPNNMAGWRPDGLCATMYGFASNQLYGWINATMHTQTEGHIYVYGYRCEGWDGQLNVYVSEDGENWNFVSDQYLNNTWPDWVDCGVSLTPFSYILLTAEDDQGSSCITVDSVRVEPLAYYNLTISSSSGGSTSPASGIWEYAETSQVPVTANPSNGYFFDYWLLDGNSSTQNPITVTMNGNHTLQANFRAAQYYDLTVSAGSGGSTNPPPGVYTDIMEGTHFDVNATADTCYQFDHWILDGQPAGSQNPISVTMNGDHALQAVFVELEGYYWLHVEAIVWDFGENYDPVCPNFYIQYGDGIYGTLPTSQFLPGNTYYLEVDQWVWSEYFQQDCRVYFIPYDSTGNGVYFQNYYADVSVNENWTCTIYYTIY